MNTFLNKGKWFLCLLGTVPFAVPVTASAQRDTMRTEREGYTTRTEREDYPTRTEREDYSTEEGEGGRGVTAGWMGDTEAWRQGQAELEQNLQPGQPADRYRRQVEKLGYQVTSVNYDEEDYLEYEVVKGDQTYEVQIEVDEDSSRATNVEIARNIWQTEATEQALEQHRATAGAAVARRGNRYSDRDRARSEQLIDELEALPVGRDKEFYKSELQRRGYQITNINTDDQEQLELEAVKQGQSVALNVDFNEETGRSTDVEASSLWMESEATQQARERQERSGARSRTTTGARGDRTGS